MKRAERFEDLIAWQKARSLANAVYQSTRQNRFAKDFALSAQLQRASVSVMANIGGFREKSFCRISSISFCRKASCAEIRSHLYVAFDIGYLNEKQFGELLAQAEEAGRIVGGLRASLKDRNKPSLHSLSQHSALRTQH
jgi:four helix bundle protein